MGKYNLGEVWWTQFPFEEIEESKRRPAIVIDDDTIAILALMVTSKDKNDPYCIKIDEWQKAGLKKESWARIDRIVRMDEWRMEKKIGDLSESDFLKITQLLAEHISGTYHEFSLLAITDPAGKFLQLYDQRWKCWLFPYYKTEEPNKENIDKHASKLLKMDVDTSYVTYAPHCKYSESDKVYKQYKHTLYRFPLSDVPEYMRDDVFELENNKYSWKTIEELEADSNVMSKNDDIIAFVKTKIVSANKK
jgi:mRNA-degrading endonuclease toxin of MazEF toxin-antitoxin module